MNATPECYDYEIGSPGWSFFYSNAALPDHRLGIAQLSNRLLIPPDALPFDGTRLMAIFPAQHPDGALPFTDASADDPPTADQSWTCFLNAANFKGPIAYYIPETWSKIGKLFKYPYIYGRGLDARPGTMGGGAMEINTVPRLDAADAQGVSYSKIPKLQFPVDAEGRSFLVEDVTYYSKAALADTFQAWRDGGAACSGRFDEKGAWKSTLTTRTTRYDQEGRRIRGVEKIFDTKVFEGNVWGLEWLQIVARIPGLFPQYFKQDGKGCLSYLHQEVPEKLQTQEFKLAGAGKAYTSPDAGAWKQPGPKAGPFTAKLGDGSVVTYWWYRFIDQPSFQQYHWSEEKKARLQSFVEKIPARLAESPATTPTPRLMRCARFAGPGAHLSNAASWHGNRLCCRSLPTRRTVNRVEL